MFIYYMEEIFKNPKTISGLTELYKRAKQQDKNIKLKNFNFMGNNFLKISIHHKFINHYQTDIFIIFQ